MNLKLSKTCEKCEIFELVATLASLNNFLVFFFSFLLKKLKSALSDSYNSLSPQNTRLFFSRFLGERRQASWGKAGKKQHLQNRLCCFAFMASTKWAWRARHARAPRRRLCARLKNANTQRLFCRLPFPY